MNILDVTVVNLGRFIVHEDYTIEEVSFTPGVDQAEIKALQNYMQGQDAPWIAPHECLLSSLANLYGFIPTVTVHTDNSEPVIPELPDIE